MKRGLFFITAFIYSSFCYSQKIDKIINAAEVERIESILAADDMQGRKTFTPGIDKAADFIAAEFAKSKLKFLGENTSYFQQITLVKTKTTSLGGQLDNQTLDESNTILNSITTDLHLHGLPGFEVVTINPGDDFNRTAAGFMQAEKNLVVLIDTTHTSRFKRLQAITSREKFSSAYTQVFIFTTAKTAGNINLHAKQEITEKKLKNVVGMLPGKSKPDEYVVFGAHYDHLGIGKPDANGDSIYNGANDDAAGTTAVMMLANYFSKQKSNERTLIFIAFTAEEIGGYGSRYFARQINPDKVMAMFNIEMIGTGSKWGQNSAYITGYEKSDMGKILQANLAGSKFRFEPDPYPKQNLFYRSDNATLAALGVPAHTISTSKMEEAPNNEPNYHKQSDEIGTLDLTNMAQIIKAIAISSKTIVAGKDTPTRIEKRN